MSDTVATGLPPVEPLAHFGEVLGPDRVCLYESLPQAYGMPRLRRGTGPNGEPLSCGHYVSVSLNDAFAFGREVDFWRSEQHVHLFLGRGDGYYLYGANASDAACAFHENRDEMHASWPAFGDGPDSLAIPREWLRPIAEAMLKFADHLDGAAPVAPEEANV